MNGTGGSLDDEHSPYYLLFCLKVGFLFRLLEPLGAMDASA